MNYSKTYLSAFVAGVCIALGGACYLSLDNKIIGAFMFSLGLLTICINEFSLFTGKVCFARKLDDIKHLVIIWIANFLGCNFIAVILRIAKPELIQKAAQMCDIKSAQGLMVIPLGFMCNIFIYFVVNNYKNLYDTKKTILLMMCVAGFILCGFEHCIANMFYFAVAGKVDVVYILLNTLGNILGGLGIAIVCDAISERG